MEFIKIGKKYLIKNSNGRIVTEKEKLQLENHELILEDIKSPCAKEITKKISKNKKRIKEIEKELTPVQTIDDAVDSVRYVVTALQDEVSNETIEEADTAV